MDRRVDKLPPLTSEDIRRINATSSATGSFDVFNPTSEAGCDPLAYAVAYMNCQDLDDEQWEAMWQQKDATLREFKRKTKKPTKKQLASIRKKVVELGKKQDKKSKTYDTKIVNYYPI